MPQAADSSTPTAKPPLPPGFAALWGAVALDLVGFGIVLPILPVYAERFDAGPATAAMIVAAFSAAQFVAAPLWGRLSDRIGRRPVLIFALVGSTIGSLLTGLADVLWVLFAARVIDGASGTSHSVAQAAVADIVPAERRSRYLGLLGAAFGLGFVAGPVIGSLAALGSDRLPFFIAAGLSAINAGLAWRSVPETHTDRTREESGALRWWNGSGGRTGLSSLVLVALVTMTAFSGFEATLGLLLDRRYGLADSSIYGTFAVVGLGLVVVQTRVVGPVVESLGERRSLAMALLVTAGGMAVLTPDAAGWVCGVALALLVIGQGITSPALSSSVVSRAGAARGAALGMQQSAGALGRVIGPVAGGLLFEHAGVGWPYGAAAVLLVVAAMVAVRSTAPEQHSARGG